MTSTKQYLTYIEVEVKKPIIKLENTTREEKIDKKVPSPTKYEPSPKKDALPQKSPIKKEPTETDDSSKNATVPDISEQKNLQMKMSKDSNRSRVKDMMMMTTTSPDLSQSVGVYVVPAMTVNLNNFLVL